DVAAVDGRQNDVARTRRQRGVADAAGRQRVVAASAVNETVGGGEEVVRAGAADQILEGTRQSQDVDGLTVVAGELRRRAAVLTQLVEIEGDGRGRSRETERVGRAARLDDLARAGQHVEQVGVGAGAAHERIAGRGEQRVGAGTAHERVVAGIAL